MNLSEVLAIIVFMKTQHQDMLDDMQNASPEELRLFEKSLKKVDKESYRNHKLIRKIFNF